MTQNPPRTHLCPLCGEGPTRIPFAGLPALEECPSCRLMLRTDRLEFSNPNIAYEEEQASVARLLSQEKNRGPYYDNWADRIERMIAPPGPLLEIGVGAGGLLRRLIERGWEVEGVESSPALFEADRESIGSRGIFHHVRLEDAGERLSLGPYRAIVAIDVLEHLPDLTLLPSIAHDLLQPNGVLVLQTPNARALRRFLQREKWEQLAPGEHYVFHSNRSLRLLLEKTGYADIAIETTSGTATDGFLRRVAMAPTGKVLNFLGAGNAFRAVARRKSR